MYYWLLKIFLTPIIKLLWISDVKGIKNIPRSGSVIIASNHESYFDFICFMAVCPRRIYYIAAEIFFKKWWWRPFVKLTNQIYVNRESNDKTSTLEASLNVLKQGKVFGIFPEGTRSENGKLNKAFVGVAKLALISKTPVVPVGITGTYEIMSRNDKWPKIGKKCKIIIGERIDLSEYYNQIDDQETLRFITDKIIMVKIAQLTGEDYNY